MDPALTCSFEDLQKQFHIAQMNVESNEGFFDDAMDTFRNLINGTSDYIASFFKKDGFDLVRYRRDRDLDEVVVNTLSSALAPLSLRQPTNLVSTFKRLLDALEKAQDLIDTLNRDSLKPAQIALAIAYSKPDVLGSEMPVPQLAALKLPNTAPVREALNACFDSNKPQGERKFFDVYANQRDFKKDSITMETLVNRYLRVSRADIRKAVEGTATVLKKIADRNDDPKDDFTVSAQNANMLAKISWELAQAVEAYALASFYLQELDRAMEANYEEIRSALRAQK